MILLLNQYLPIFFLFYTIVYWKRNKQNDFIVLLIFCSFYTLGSNFSFVAYRILYQIILIIILILNVVSIKKIPLNVVKLLFFYLIAILTSGIGSRYNKLYFDTVINFIFNASVVVYICTKIKDADAWDSVLHFCSNIGCVLSILAVLCFLIEPSRIELVSSNSNYFAFALGVSFVTSLFVRKNIVVNLIIMLGIFTTASRSILLVCILIFAITQIRYYKSKLLFILPVLFVIVLGIASLFVKKNVTGSSVETTVLSRFVNMDEDASVQIRYEIYDVAKKMIVEHPINGIGYGQFQYQFFNYLPGTAFYLLKIDEIVTHNDYVRIIVELGIIGTLLFLIILFSSVHKIRGLSKLQRELCFSLMTLSLFFSMSHNNMNTFVFWMILLLPVLLQTISNDD